MIYKAKEFKSFGRRLKNGKWDFFSIVKNPSIFTIKIMKNRNNGVV